MDGAIERADNRRREQAPAPQMPRELAALYHGDGNDKKRSAEIMRWRSLLAEQLAKAEEFKVLDGYESPG